MLFFPTWNENERKQNMPLTGVDEVALLELGLLKGGLLLGQEVGSGGQHLRFFLVCVLFSLFFSKQMRL